MFYRKKIALFFVGSLVLVLSLLYFQFTKKQHIEVVHIQPDSIVSSENLVANFLSDQSQANHAFTDKIIEVVGKVKEVSFLNNRNTLILQGPIEDSGIICDMNSDQFSLIKKLQKGQKVKIKGICKGFLKDVIMLNCIMLVLD